MTPPTFSIGGIGGFPSATVETITFLPGGKTIQDGTGLGGVHAFTVTETGEVEYDPTKDGFFVGSGTSKLTVVGYDIIIDATALTPPMYFISGIGGFDSDTGQAVRTFRTVPVLSMTSKS